MSNKDHPEYSVWKNMRRRCNSSKSTGFRRWGGRGIKVCQRWESFANFLLDMGRRPSPAHTIERRDNNGDYTPSNCVWATQQEQSRNRSSNRMVFFNGRRMTLAEAAKITGVDHSLFIARVNLGWTEHDALNVPVRKHGKLSRQQIAEIKSDDGAMRAIAAKYGIGLVTVWRIKKGLKTRVRA